MKKNNAKAESSKDIRTAFIKFPHIVRILAALDRLYDYQCDNEDPEHIILLGESGVGKSTLVKRYARQHPRIEHDEYTEVPVLYMRIGPKPTRKALAQKSLEMLGDLLWFRGTEPQLTARFIGLLRTCRVRLVIVDEANHLVDGTGKKTLHTAADWFKCVIDDSKISYVFVGIPRVKRLLATNDQLRGRLREVIQIDRFSVANESAELEFRSALKNFKICMGDLPAIDISGATITRLFAFATDGRVRDICKLLARAVELAYAQPDPGLTDKVLAEAFRTVIYSGAPDNRNPFHETFNEMPLVKNDEPFAPEDH
ncbi:TniB family NTP-binding protein [Paraburkholderia megapolitana]|uniref:TniB protein n=1 Tax=Paraburkholderia megapolitana TaxID=420953 RepID=A0A1I3UP89_9BURK|nr:TniB family NTP-binding protein [Paraburkholderia megapolitana]QDQ82299.1 AAA family ATPase [Paraburkholderia megapolitana]SFJ84735.1 TniB protein [Paraburkholderia megapolitana]